MHYIIYGHGGSYNHGAEAIVRTTIALLRKISPGCKITLSTHFAEQDRQFKIDADEFVERNQQGKTNEEIYAPTIEHITPHSVCLHIGGDNYCYRNWQRWATIHHAALKRGAKSILWSCSIDPDVIDTEMLAVLSTHHLITAREGATYRELIEHKLTNVVKVSDIAFTLKPEPVDSELKNYVALNVSPLVLNKNAILKSAYHMLIHYILDKTPFNIALVPHVIQPVDNDFDALSSLIAHNSARVKLVSEDLSAGQYKMIIGKARFCVAARTHAAIAAYSSCVPTLAVGYSVKSLGIAEDLGMTKYLASAELVSNELNLVESFKRICDNEESIKAQLAKQMPSYIANVINDGALKLLL